MAEGTLALDPVSIWLGGYYANTEVDIAAKGNPIDAETGKIQLAEGDETVARARLDVLLFGSQGLEFDYYTLDHSTSQTLTQPFSFQGVPFQLDTTLRGKVEFNAGEVAYHWWFGDDTDAFGVGLGGAYYRAKLKIEGTASFAGQTSSGSASWDGDAIAPLVTLGWRHQRFAARLFRRLRHLQERRHAQRTSLRCARRRRMVSVAQRRPRRRVRRYAHQARSRRQHVRYEPRHQAARPVAVRAFSLLTSDLSQRGKCR